MYIHILMIFLVFLFLTKTLSSMMNLHAIKCCSILKNLVRDLESEFYSMTVIFYHGIWNIWKKWNMSTDRHMGLGLTSRCFDLTSRRVQCARAHTHPHTHIYMEQQMDGGNSERSSGEQWGYISSMGQKSLERGVGVEWKSMYNRKIFRSK